MTTNLSIEKILEILQNKINKPFFVLDQKKIPIQKLISTQTSFGLKISRPITPLSTELTKLPTLQTLTTSEMPITLESKKNFWDKYKYLIIFISLSLSIMVPPLATSGFGDSRNIFRTIPEIPNPYVINDDNTTIYVDPRYNYKPKDSTVSSNMLHISCVLVSLFGLLFVCWFWKLSMVQQKHITNPKYLMFWKAHGHGMNLMKYLGHFSMMIWFAFIMEKAASTFTKFWILRPRPDMIQNCKTKEAEKIYFGDDTQDTKDGDTKDSAKEATITYCSDSIVSFTSGHSSLAITIFFTFAYYLFLMSSGAEFNMKEHFGSITTVRLTGVLAMVIAMWIAYTRIADNRHAPEDVLGGIILGLLCSGTSFFLFRDFMDKTSNIQ